MITKTELNGIWHRLSKAQITQQKQARAWQAVSQAHEANSVHNEVKKILKLSAIADNADSEPRA